MFVLRFGTVLADVQYVHDFDMTDRIRAPALQGSIDKLVSKKIGCRRAAEITKVHEVGPTRGKWSVVILNDHLPQCADHKHRRRLDEDLLDWLDDMLINLSEQRVLDIYDHFLAGRV
jgi:hypothetical protein